MSNLVRGSKPSRISPIISKVSTTAYPFAAKELPDGSKIFRRIRSATGTVSSGPTNIDFIVPFSKCKITGVQILGAELGDSVSFQVLDTSSGTISGIPNFVLNEFGTGVYIVPDVANYPSKYDADLIQGLVLRLVYTPVAGAESKSIYVNYDLHQVV